MSPISRVAVGNIHSAADSRLMTWGLLRALAERQIAVQHFCSRACHCPLDAALPATGNPSRHLDSWLMSPALSTALFVRGVRTADLAIVEGSYAHCVSGPASQRRPGSSLDDLCQTLGLARLAVVDAAAFEHCCLPPRPRLADGLLLDRVRGPDHFCRVQTTIEALWKVPVLGGLEELPRLRSAIADLPCGSTVPQSIVSALGENFARYARLDRILRLAARPPLTATGLEPVPAAASVGRLVVAVAYDDAFQGYFVDTLDLLELLGARVVDFSPLRDEELPAGADLVYFGCGHPERYLSALAANKCLLASLWSHMRRGRRIFAEGGGLAYLCQYLEMPDGRRWPLAGVLPAVARLSARRLPLEPVELSLTDDNWLADEQTPVRGYLNPNWIIDPLAPLERLVADTGHECDLVGWAGAIGSRLQLHFAAQPALFSRLLHPRQRAARASAAGSLRS